MAIFCGGKRKEEREMLKGNVQKMQKASEEEDCDDGFHWI